MNPIKVAQIGTCHDHASQIMVCMKLMPDLFDIVGIAEPDVTKFNAIKDDNSYDGIKVYDSVEALLSIPDLQAVTVETDEFSLCKYADMCIERSIPIHLDKPGAMEEKSFIDLMMKAKAKNIPIHLGYMYRYNPLVKKALLMKQNGDFGDIFSIEAQMSIHHKKEKREWLGNFHGGMMYFLGCHLIDLVMQFQGIPEDVVPFNSCTGAEDESFCEDYSMAVLKYANGVSYVRTCAAEINGFARRQLVICGTNATLEINPLETKAPVLDSSLRYTRMISQGKITKSGDAVNDWRDCSIPIESDCFGRFDDMLTEFAAIVNKEIENPYSYDYEISLYKTIMKACGR